MKRDSWPPVRRSGEPPKLYELTGLMVGDRRGCSLRVDGGAHWALELRPMDYACAGKRVRIWAHRIGFDLLSVVSLELLDDGTTA